MRLLSPHPFWPIQDGLPTNYPPLTENVRCDVVVIGGGVSGALAALHLVEAGLDVVLVDRRDVAHGSTAGSTSLLQYEIDEPLHRLAQRYGIRHAEACYRRCRDAIDAIGRLVARHGIDCGFERRSSLFLASGKAHVPMLRREWAARRAAGFRVAWWDRARIAAESSLPHPAGIMSADGAQLDAYRLTYGLLGAAARRGARIFDRSEVTATHHGRTHMELRTPGGRIRARHLVCATGYEADLQLPRPLTKLRSTFALITEPAAEHPGWPARDCLIWETADPYVYLRTTPDGRIIIGGYDEEFRDAARRDRVLAAKTGYLERRLRQLLPRLRAPTAYSWAGTFARTDDGLPFIGRHPHRPRTWLALGYGGNGITFSLIAAELIRDGIVGRDGPDEAIFAFARTSAMKTAS